VLEPVDLVMTALAAGAAAGVTSVASTAVKDTYQFMISLTRKALIRGSGHNNGETIDGTVDQFLAEPLNYQNELRSTLASTDACADAMLTTAARHLLSLLNAENENGGKYRIEAHDNQAVQVGDGNTMTLHLGAQS